MTTGPDRHPPGSPSTERTIILTRTDIWRKVSLSTDGVDELLLGEDVYYDAENSWNAIYAGYTLKNGAAVRFLDGWARNRFSLCEGNYLKNEASSGASNTVINIYRFDGDKLQLDHGNTVILAEQRTAAGRKGG